MTEPAHEDATGPGPCGCQKDRSDPGRWRPRAWGRQRVSTAANKKTPIGYDYVHSAVDDHSRLGYSEILDDEQGATSSPPSELPM